MPFTSFSLDTAAATTTTAAICIICCREQGTHSSCHDATKWNINNNAHTREANRKKTSRRLGLKDCTMKHLCNRSSVYSSVNTYHREREREREIERKRKCQMSLCSLIRATWKAPPLWSCKSSSLVTYTHTHSCTRTYNNICGSFVPVSV